jgi:hypothetical protein
MTNRQTEQYDANEGEHALVRHSLSEPFLWSWKSGDPQERARVGVVLLGFLPNQCGDQLIKFAVPANGVWPVHGNHC